MGSRAAGFAVEKATTVSTTGPQRLQKIGSNRAQFIDDKLETSPRSSAGRARHS